MPAAGPVGMAGVVGVCEEDVRERRGAARWPPGVEVEGEKGEASRGDEPG